MYTAILSAILLGLVGWQIGIQVQVSNVDATVPPSFGLMSVNSSNAVTFLLSSASSQYVTSNNIDLNNFLVTSLSSMTATLSGKQQALMTLFVIFTSTVDADGIAPLSLTVKLPNIPQNILFGGAPLNTPIVFRVDATGLFLVGNLSMDTSTSPVQLTASIIPKVGTLSGSMLSMSVTTLTSDFF